MGGSPASFAGALRALKQNALRQNGFVVTVSTHTFQHIAQAVLKIFEQRVEQWIPQLRM